MNKKSVLFITNIPSPYRVDFFQALGELCDLTVLYEKKDASDRDGRWIHVEENTSYTQIFMKSVISLSSSAFCPEVVRHIAKGNYDIIVVGVYSTPTGMYAIEYMNRKKIPYIINCDGGLIKETKGVRYFLKSHFIKRASAWLSTGKMCDEYLMTYGAVKERIFRYPFTSVRESEIVNKQPTFEQKRTLRDHMGVAEEVVLLSVGSYIPRKGHDVLMQAAAELGIEQTLGLYIVGGTAPEEYLDLAKCCEEKNERLHIHFVDFMQRQEIMNYYEMADLFVLATREDIWGLVINEAMSRALPVITTSQCVAGAELLQKEQLVDFDNIEGLAQTMEKLLMDRQKMSEVAESNRCKMYDYTIETMAKRHEEIFGLYLDEE